jgi:uncharacterized protein
MRKIYLLSFLIFVSLQSIMAQTVYTVETVPNPTVTGDGYVSNPDNVLSTETVATINSLIVDLKQKTTDEIAVVVLNSIGTEDSKNFSTSLFNKWGIGLKGKNNGLLILMIMDKRRVEFETGYGMEAVLPDAICKRIEETYMVPRFKEGNYDQGIMDGLTATLDILENKENSQYFVEMKVAETSANSETRNTATGILALFFIVVTGIAYLVKRSNKSFEDLYKKADKKEKEKITLVMSQLKWILLYAAIPSVLIGVLYFFYGGDDYIIVLAAVVYCYIIFILLEKRIRSNGRYKALSVEDDYYGNYTKYTKAHAGWWWAALFFPVPFLFYVFYYLNHKRSLRNHPRNCKACSNELLKLSEIADDQHLTKSQLLEEELKSVDYDVWFCGKCSAKQVLSYKNTFSKYSECKSCKTRAYYLQSNITLVSPTYDSSGTGEKTYMCKYCHKSHSETYSIARLERSSSSSSSSSSSGGGGSSFGGGSSGGGGSGSSW